MFSFPSEVGTPGDEVSALSLGAKRMIDGSKTDRALLDLVRDKMAKAARVSGQQTVTSSDGYREVIATSSYLPPRPKRAKKVEEPGWMPQLATDLGGVLSS